MYMYVVLVRAMTGLGIVCRSLGKYEYTHIAVSFQEKLTEFVSFSRRKHYAPFDAGFMREKVEHYAFGPHQKVRVKVFKIPVTKESMERIQAYVKMVEEDEEYVFHLYAMLTMPFLHGFRLYKAHNCMSFVANLLKLSGVKLAQPYYKYNIKQMDELLTPYLEGERYLYKKKEDTAYMERVGIFENGKSLLDLNKKLLHRMFYRNSYE